MLTYLFLCLFITNVYAETVETPYLVADTSTDKTREIIKEEDLYYLRKEGKLVIITIVVNQMTMILKQICLSMISIVNIQLKRQIVLIT